MTASTMLKTFAYCGFTHIRLKRHVDSHSDELSKTLLNFCRALLLALMSKLGRYEQHLCRY